jgi:4-amino-4-deoxy-L-arabinose transferase-like glycosyltransferase
MKSFFKRWSKRASKEGFWLLGAVVVLAVGLRVWFVSDGNVMFLFDQARDARVSRQILEEGRLKLLGPTASGSNDMLYHGVLYYYVTGPLYTFFGGNPQWVAYALALVLSLSVVSVYKASLVMTNRRDVAYAASVFSASSASSILALNWLSNPIFLVILIPAFFYFLFTFIEKPQTKTLLLATLCAGLSLQSFLFTAYLWLILGGVYFFVTFIQKRNVFSIKQVLGAGLTAILVTGSMVAAQAIQWYRGILDFSTMANIGTGASGLVDNIKITGSLYFQHLAESMAPNLPLAAGVIGVMGLSLALIKMSPKQRVYAGLIFAGPLLFYALKIKGSYYTLLGFQPLLLTIVLAGLWRGRLGQNTFVKAVMILIICSAQIWTLVRIKYDENIHTPYAVQKGIMLKDQLELIDYTYMKAEGEPFTISTFTNPYMYNITWDYLYSWYGLRHYGYVPRFKGVDQSYQYGIRMVQVNDFAPVHFAIFEPDTGLDEGQMNALNVKQNVYPIESPPKLINFGKLELAEFIE